MKKCICVVFMAVSAAAFAGDAKKELNPKFPVVGGTMKVTNEWSLELPEKFNRRFEDGSMVIWRPEFTIWISVWENENKKSPYDQLDYIRADKSKDAFDITEMKSADIYRYSYRIDEYREEAKKTARWQAIALAACKQSGNPWMPRIAPVRTLGEALGVLPKEGAACFGALQPGAVALPDFLGSLRRNGCSCKRQKSCRLP